MTATTLTTWQIAAIEAASAPAGAYLDSIGKTDLATFTEGEWYRFLEEVCVAYHEEHEKQKASGEPPY
jgi:hypothetical protein